MATVQSTSTAPLTGRWPQNPLSVPLARQELRAALAAWGRADLADAAELVLSELMTNALRHAADCGWEIETRVELDGDGVRLEVHDASDARPHMRVAGDEDDGGRGLGLVDAITGHRWGVLTDLRSGKSVWALVGGGAGDP